jgi:hypothetical protein
MDELTTLCRENGKNWTKRSRLLKVKEPVEWLASAI